MQFLGGSELPRRGRPAAPSPRRAGRGRWGVSLLPGSLTSTRGEILAFANDDASAKADSDGGAIGAGRCGERERLELRSLCGHCDSVGIEVANDGALGGSTHQCLGRHGYRKFSGTARASSADLTEVCRSGPRFRRRRGRRGQLHLQIFADTDDERRLAATPAGACKKDRFVGAAFVRLRRWRGRSGGGPLDSAGRR